MKALKYCSALLLCLFFTSYAHALRLSGTTDIHDPSTIVKDGNTYWTFGTGAGTGVFPINALYSTDMVNWKRAPSPIPNNTYPSWIRNKVPGFDGNFWAPDLIEMNGRFYLYYSAFSASSGMHSAIGVMVTDSLNSPNWRDLGMVVSTINEAKSPQGQPVNVIDAGLFRDAAGKVWMVYGSHYAGIYVREINPATGMLQNNNRYPVVGNNGNWHEFEAAQVQYINGYYYMFVNLGDCCAGNQSNYYVVTGRATSPTGPYLDANGVDLWHYGGTTVLSSSGNYIGPGHFGYIRHGNQDLATIHYYDGTSANGWPARLDVLKMNFSNGWPTFSRNFSLGADTKLQDGRVTFISDWSGKAIDVDGRSTDDGANIMQWASTGGTNQKWDITHIGGGFYSIRAAHSGKSMDVYQWSTENGGDIRQWAFSGGENQQWEIRYAGNGKYAIISKFSGKALDVFEWSTEDGGDIRQWEFWGGEPQLWNVNY